MLVLPSKDDIQSKRTIVYIENLDFATILAARPSTNKSGDVFDSICNSLGEFMTSLQTVEAPNVDKFLPYFIADSSIENYELVDGRLRTLFPMWTPLSSLLEQSLVESNRPKFHEDFHIDVETIDETLQSKGKTHDYDGITNEMKLLTLIRRDGREWLRVAGLSTRSPLDISPGLDILERYIKFATSDNYGIPPHSKTNSSSNQVSPVHWEDIGGLDR